MPVLEFSTKQLTRRTWSDFERLFETHPAPGAYPCWCMHNHRSGQEKKTTSRATWIKRNHTDKRALVEQGRSDGILVYSHGEPVGWCQYGLVEELPRIDNNPQYRKLASCIDSALWRITCFVVHKKYRRRGVARTALRAALTVIQNKGGGLVEAYPIKRWGAYADYRGTVSMFKKEGFEIVAPLGESNVLMRRKL
jgi:ribosomal protein S18 acetylase RimI-like enzyme